MHDIVCQLAITWHCVSAGNHMTLCVSWRSHDIVCQLGISLVLLIFPSCLPQPPFLPPFLQQGRAEWAHLHLGQICPLWRYWQEQEGEEGRRGLLDGREGGREGGRERRDRREGRREEEVRIKALSDETQLIQALHTPPFTATWMSKSPFTFLSLFTSNTKICAKNRVQRPNYWASLIISWDSPWLDMLHLNVCVHVLYPIYCTARQYNAQKHVYTRENWSSLVPRLSSPKLSSPTFHNACHESWGVRG